jgi:hypothetical protein
LAKKPLQWDFLDLKAPEWELMILGLGLDPPFSTPLPSLTHWTMYLKI